MKYSGRTSAYQHKFNDWQEHSIDGVEKAIRKQWVLDAQWTDCPVEIENIVKALWRLYDCGNDRYIIKLDIPTLLDIKEDGEEDEVWEGEWITKPIDIDSLIEYLKEHGISDEDTIWIHWWW